VLVARGFLSPVLWGEAAGMRGTAKLAKFNAFARILILLNPTSPLGRTGLLVPALQVRLETMGVIAWSGASLGKHL
jgi:hypothetical protein